MIKNRQNHKVPRACVDEQNHCRAYCTLSLKRRAIKKKHKQVNRARDVWRGGALSHQPCQEEHIHYLVGRGTVKAQHVITKRIEGCVETHLAITSYTVWYTIMVTKAIRIQKGVAFMAPEAVFVPCLTNGFNLDIGFNMLIIFYYRNDSPAPRNRLAESIWDSEEILNPIYEENRQLACQSSES